MTIITESKLRELVKQPQVGLKIALPCDVRFSPSAQDFIQQWKLEILQDDSAAENKFDEGKPAKQEFQKPSWDKPGEFPVVLSGEIPRCDVCGSTLQKKPETMTQLNAEEYTLKTNPRIIFRGKMDSVHAIVLLIAAKAKEENLSSLVSKLKTIAAYCRELVSAEYNEKVVGEFLLDGVTDEEIHTATHKPEQIIGVPHIVPDENDVEILLWLNYLRCQIREAEISALDAFFPFKDNTYQASIIRGINRLSNVIYYLELLMKAGKLQ